MLYVVTGPVAVVRTESGGESYLHRGRVFDGDEFANVKHLLRVGLVKEHHDPVDAAAESGTQPQAESNVESDTRAPVPMRPRKPRSVE